MVVPLDENWLDLNNKTTRLPLESMYYTRRWLLRQALAVYPNKNNAKIPVVQAASSHHFITYKKKYQTYL